MITSKHCNATWVHNELWETAKHDWVIEAVYDNFSLSRTLLARLSDSYAAFKFETTNFKPKKLLRYKDWIRQAECVSR